MFSRYEALGISWPDPETMCLGQCEGTGVVPVYGSDRKGEPKENEVRPVDEPDPVLRALWLEAEAKEPADDGWHFVVCPDCKGTRLRTK